MGAASRGLWEADEHRLAEIAREMVTGGDWAVPHLEGARYVHKPPLVAWIIALCHGPLGMDLALAAKVPSMLGAALAVTATFLIARRFYGNAAAIAAAIALAAAGEFAWICRRAQYDPLLAGFTTFALWFFVRSRFPAEDDPPRPWRDAIAGGLCVGLAGMTKGPAAVAFTVPAFVAFALVAGEWRSLPTRRAAAAVAAALVPAAIWFGVAAAREGWGFAGEVLGHGAEHAAGDVDKVEKPYFYLLWLPKGFAPWTLLLPAGVAAVTLWRRAEERRADLFVLAAIVAPFLVMSAIPPKRGIYLLPLLAPASLLVGKLAVTDEQRLRSLLVAVPRYLLAALCVVAGAAVSAVAVASLLGYDESLVAQFTWWAEARDTLPTPLVGLAAALGFMVALSGMRAVFTPSPQDALGRLLGGALAATILFAGVMLPAMDPLASPRDFYESAAAKAGDAPVLRYGVDDYAGHWVMKRERIPLAVKPEHVAKFLEKEKGAAFVVAERSTVEQEGMPAGAETVLEIHYPFGHDMMLLTRGR